MKTNYKKLIDQTVDFMKNKFAKESSGHDWWHLYRVWGLAKHIASKEKNADMLVVELAALLHDVADHKFHDGDTEIGAVKAGEWLTEIGAPADVIGHVQDIVRNISFRGANHKIDLKTLEGQIVHDADKLDAIGAIGIARTFTFGGAHGRLIYDPDQPHVKDYTYEAAVIANTSAIHHFYEKLLLLKDRMFTETGRQMALARHEFMEQYLEEFYAEWDGKK